MLEYSGKKILQRDILERFVIGWDGITELDIYSAGDSTAVPFDKALFNEWIEDHRECWTPITSAVVEAYAAHDKAINETTKN